jgi:hypothetical protein
MGLSEFEVLSRCESLANSALNNKSKASVGLAINLYLIVSRHFNDIDEQTFKTLITYFSDKLGK